MLALQIAALAVAVFDIVDAAMRPADAFVAAGKLTKPTWLVIVGASAAVILLAWMMLLLSIPAVVAVLVYLVDVRPAVRAVAGGRPPSASSW